jgi:hypothetical protein
MRAAWGPYELDPFTDAFAHDQRAAARAVI